jgi:hypothetical protein
LVKVLTSPTLPGNKRISKPGNKVLFSDVLTIEQPGKICPNKRIDLSFKVVRKKLLEVVPPLLIRKLILLGKF